MKGGKILLTALSIICMLVLVSSVSYAGDPTPTPKPTTDQEKDFSGKEI